MKIAVIDNYDSFTYNLVGIIRKLGYEPQVMRNDQIDHDILKASSHFILSPGPGIPDEAGELKNVIKNYSESKNILGICLGHQAIAEVFGGQLENMDTVFHGSASEIQIQNDILFKGLRERIKVGLYHSWVVKNVGFENGFDVLAADESGRIMAIKHKTKPIRGVQFHPESILTPEGDIIIKNFLES